MVAPPNTGEPVSSFVRVNSKGQETKALCWDLSRSSTIVAALAPMKLPLPAPMLPATPLPPCSPAQAMSPPGTKPVPATPSLPVSQPQQATASTLSKGKRPREEQQQQGSEEGTSRPKVTRTTAGTERAVWQPAHFLPGKEDELQQLRQLCLQLQQQNKDLQERLHMVYSLLKDEKRLSKVVKQLNAMVK